MWQHTYCKAFPGITTKQVWHLWTDINSWPKWHTELESCTFQGDFRVGNSFLLKPKGMRAVKIKLSEVTKEHSFTDCTSFPGAKMYDKHTIVETDDGVMITNTISVQGPLKWLWAKLVATKVASNIPKELDNLAALASTQHV